MSLLDRLNEAGEFAPAWKPRDPGAPQYVLGELTEVGQSTDSEGRPYLIYTIRQEDGTRLAVHAFHGVLKQELAKYKLKVGVELGVKFLGQPDGKKYYRYAVVSDAEMNLDPGPIEDDRGFTPASDVPSSTIDFRPQATGVKAADGSDLPF